MRDRKNPFIYILRRTTEQLEEIMRITNNRASEDEYRRQMHKAIKLSRALNDNE